MTSPLAATVEEDGVVGAFADVNGFTLADLRFPAGHVQLPFEPAAPYLAVVLRGGVAKSFPCRTLELDEANALTMPVSATHGARFAGGARIAIVKLRDSSSTHAGVFDRLTLHRGALFAPLAWRLVAELRATDAGAPLAAEGLALELLAAATREPSAGARTSRPPAGLRAAEELLRADGRTSLSEVAAAVGVHPTHLARAFRLQFGVSVGEYGRRLRIARAASDVAETELSLSVISHRAGFADQSHFTRLFRRYVGTTPARYRASTRLGTFQEP
jgi:AraC family transcriptional regulator